MIALTALVLLLVLVVLVSLFALMDQHRVLLEIQEHLGTGDAPRPLTHPIGPVVASDAGLPAHLDGAERAVVVFLSTTCATCATVGRGLRGPLAPELHVVVRAPSAAEGARWYEEVGLHAGSVTVSTDDRVADAFGLRVTPAAFVLRHDHIVVAQTVPTVRQLTALLDQVAALAGEPVPTPAADDGNPDGRDQWMLT